MNWPSGKQFAFSIFDDSDWATLERVKPVYDLLANLGMRTTKSVWVFRGERENPKNEGSTCEDPEYVKWLLQLQTRGFEIGLHNVAPSTSSRERVRLALERFRDLFGKQMLTHCNHAGCREDIYWGGARLSGWRRPLYNLLTNSLWRDVSRGHIEGDPLFWGDLCREHIRYVRNFVFDDLDTLAICPEMPYHDPTKPFVNFWFASADGGNLVRFLRNFTHRSIDNLVAAGGLCIAYVHFGGGFVRKGVVDPEFRERLEYLASRNGWFVPVSTVLDHLRAGGSPKDRQIPPDALRRLETRWLLGAIGKGIAKLGA